jgi:hypothetical protein
MTSYRRDDFYLTMEGRENSRRIDLNNSLHLWTEQIIIITVQRSEQGVGRTIWHAVEETPCRERMIQHNMNSELGR